MAISNQPSAIRKMAIGGNSHQRSGRFFLRKNLSAGIAISGQGGFFCEKTSQRSERGKCYKTPLFFADSRRLTADGYSRRRLTAIPCLILMLCCFLLQPLEANETVELSGDTAEIAISGQGGFSTKNLSAVRKERFGLSKPSLLTADCRRLIAMRIDKIAYYIDTALVGETTEQYNTLSHQAAVRVADRLSQYAIQQSIKKLYATQQYSQIQVYAQEHPNGVALTYQLTSFARIKAVVVAGIPPNEFRSAIENVIKSKPGGRYVPAIAKTDIIYIKRICREHGYFNAQVTVADVLTEDGVLTYQITPGAPSTIKRLQIQGNSAISNNRLRAACGFSIRQPVYNKADVDTDVAAMETLYRKNNYPTATIQIEFTAKTGLLQFQINEGKRVALNFVSDADRFSLKQQRTFKEEIGKLISTGSPSLWERRIKAYFEGEGYHGTTVQENTLDASSVQLTINPGTQYRVTSVTFSGNYAFSDANLRREMTVKPTGRFLWNLRISNIIARFLSQREQKRFFYAADLEKDEHRLDILYDRAGYPNAVIEITDKKQPVNGRNIGEVAIHVSVTENYREVIHRCTISGNQAIGTPTLLRRLENELPLPQPNASFEKTVYRNVVIKAYHEFGYIGVKVDDEYISETPVFDVNGDFSESLAEGELSLEIFDAFKKHNLALTGLSMATNVGNRWSIQDTQGNPRYTLKQETTHLEVFEHGILNLTVEAEGERVAFGKFYFEGDTDVVKQHVLKREVRHLEGNLWTSDGLSRALQNLYGLGIFRGVQYRRVQAAPLETEKTNGNESVKGLDGGNPHPVLKTSDVLITVEKQEKPTTYRYGGGYSFAEGWRGSLELTNSNFLFKRNIQGSFLGRLGWRDELGYLVDARLTEPWLISRTRGTLQVSAKKLEIDDNVRALQGSFILSRKLGESYHLDLRYSYRDLAVGSQVGFFSEKTSQPSAKTQALQETSSLADSRLLMADGYSRTTVSSLRFSWTYDSLVQHLNPIGGMLNEVTLEYAGGLLQGETSFIKTTTDTQYYQKLIGDIVLATAVRLGVTTGLRSNRRAELISFERFWAGGSTTVRGYAERSLGPEHIAGIHRGDVQFIFNTELRFPIYSIVRGAFFFDAGNVWDSLADIETLTRLPSAVGTGLYLDFGALTVGLDYAIPLVSVPSSPDTRRAHFRLGSTF